MKIGTEREIDPNQIVDHRTDAAMLDAVSRTQVRAKVIPSQSQEVSFKDLKEFMNYFSTITL